MIHEDQLIEMLLQENEVDILQLLDLTTRDLVYRFLFKIRERKDYLEKYYDETFEDSEEEFGIGVHIRTWEEELSNEDYYGEGSRDYDKDL